MLADPSRAPSNPRVVVVGNSVSVLCRPKGTDRFEPTYAGRLARRCRERGAEIDVVNQGRWFERINTAWRRWDADVAPLLPSAVVVNYGFVECQPFVVPHVVHRALLDWKTRTSRMSALGRRLLVVPGRRYIGRATPLVSTAVGQRTHKLSPTRFETELTRYIRSCRGELGALVLVVGINPPGPHMLRMQPGIDERCRRFDGIQRRVVDGFADPLVRFVDVTPIFDQLGQTGASADGIHLTPEGHELLAGLLAEHVAAHVATVGRCR